MDFRDKIKEAANRLGHTITRQQLEYWHTLLTGKHLAFSALWLIGFDSWQQPVVVPVYDNNPSKAKEVQVEVDKGKAVWIKAP